MPLTRRETTRKSAELTIDSVIKTYEYIEIEVAKHFQKAEFEASISKRQGESIEELTTHDELKNELGDIHDLRLIRSIEIEAHDYTNDFHLTLLLDTDPILNRAVSLNIRCRDKSRAVALDSGIYEKLGAEKNANWVASLIWPYIVLPYVFSAAFVSLIVFAFRLDPKYLWLIIVAGLLGIFFPQSKIEKLYPAIIIVDESRSKTNGRVLSRDAKKSILWFALVILAGIVLRAFKIN